MSGLALSRDVRRTLHPISREEGEHLRSTSNNVQIGPTPANPQITQVLDFTQADAPLRRFLCLIRRVGKPRYTSLESGGVCGAEAVQCRRTESPIFQPDTATGERPRIENDCMTCAVSGSHGNQSVLPRQLFSLSPTTTPKRTGRSSARWNSPWRRST